MKKILTCFLCILCLVFLMPQNISSASEEKESFVKLPILMYHDILNSRKSRYIVSEKQLEKDFAMLQENGYEAVLPSEILAYVEGKISLPKKPVLITFDDGRYNNLFYGLPLLKKYNMKAVFNIVGSFTDQTSNSVEQSNPNYSHLTWQEIKQAANSGYVEIGNHSWEMHKYSPRYGISQKPNESLEDYQKKLTNDVLKLQLALLEKSSVATNIFAFPFGKYTESAFEILSELGFKIFFTCNEGINFLKAGDFETLKHLKRFNREGYYTTDVVKMKIEK